jgi:glycosyltransferase involved in cell wall biosynthesis
MSDSARLHLLLFAYYYPPENTSGAARPARLTRYLPEANIHCHVIAHGQPPPDQARANTTYVLPGKGRPLGEALCRFTQRYLLRINERLDWVPAALAAARDHARRHPVDAIFSTSPPLAPHLAALAFHRQTGLPWIADFRDPLAGNATRVHRFFNYDHALERRIFRHASLCLANTDGLAAQWRQRHPACASKIHLLWNGFDPAVAPPAPRPRAAGPKVILHAGSLYANRRPGNFLQALAALAQSGDLKPGDWQAVLLGPTAPDTFLHSESERADLERAGLLHVDSRLASREEAAQAQADADILLLLDIPESDNSIQVPAKLFDYARTGQPIIAWTPEGSPARRLLEQAGPDVLCLSPLTPTAEAAARLSDFLRRPLTRRPLNPAFAAAFDGRQQALTLASAIRALQTNIVSS